jgi:thiol-disulfide isomerase/thioredoxin
MSAARNYAPARTAVPKNVRKPTKFNESNYQEALKSAAKTSKPLVLKVGAKWCGPCQKMKQNMAADKKLGSQLEKNATFVNIDADKARELTGRKNLNISAYPTVILGTVRRGPDGKLKLNEIKRENYMTADQFKGFLNDKNTGLSAMSKKMRAAGFGPQ